MSPIGKKLLESSDFSDVGGMWLARGAYTHNMIKYRWSPDDLEYYQKIREMSDSKR